MLMLDPFDGEVTCHMCGRVPAIRLPAANGADGTSLKPRLASIWHQSTITEISPRPSAGQNHRAAESANSPHIDGLLLKHLPDTTCALQRRGGRRWLIAACSPLPKSLTACS
jgi:hypothetical protein